MIRSKFMIALSAALAGGAVGVGGAFLGNASASSSTNRAHLSAHGARGMPTRAMRRAVHVTAVLPGKNGTFTQVSYDRGVVQSVNGSQLVLHEGTAKATYRTVTLTIPSNAVVRDDRKPATLTEVKPGQVAFVFQGPKQRVRVGAMERR
ncbi:MAG: hypothetical protein ACYCU0_11685 [Solirubrobacteraceae bacterium]